MMRIHGVVRLLVGVFHYVVQVRADTKGNDSVVGARMAAVGLKLLEHASLVPCLVVVA